jgi:hypothetical protein
LEKECEATHKQLPLIWETSPTQLEWNMILMKAAETQKEKKGKDTG